MVAWVQPNEMVYVTTIGLGDLHKTVLRRGHTQYHVADIIGRVQRADIGKWVYSDACGLLSVENAQQRAERQRQSQSKET
jgi:hypothetical protein